eukprot:2210707-Prymnesium_polylepis.1
MPSRLVWEWLYLSASSSLGCTCSGGRCDGAQCKPRTVATGGSPMCVLHCASLWQGRGRVVDDALSPHNDPPIHVCAGDQDL